MELEVVVFIIVGVIIAYLVYRSIFKKTNHDLSNTVSHDIVNAPYKVEPPVVAPTVATEVVTQEVKAPELKVENGGKQSSQTRTRKPRASKSNTTAAKPAAKPVTKSTDKPIVKPKTAKPKSQTKVAVKPTSI